MKPIVNTFIIIFFLFLTPVYGQYHKPWDYYDDFDRVDGYTKIGLYLPFTLNQSFGGFFSTNDHRNNRFGWGFNFNFYEFGGSYNIDKQYFNAGIDINYNVLFLSEGTYKKDKTLFGLDLFVQPNTFGDVNTGIAIFFAPLVAYVLGSDLWPGVDYEFRLNYKLHRFWRFNKIQATPVIEVRFSASFYE